MIPTSLSHLAELAAKAQAKAPGPYVIEWADPEGEPDRGVEFILDANGERVIVADSGVYPPSGVVAQFIAAAHPDRILSLIAEVRRLRADLKEACEIGLGYITSRERWDPDQSDRLEQLAKLAEEP
jgi:hypothetical protein